MRTLFILGLFTFDYRQLYFGKLEISFKTKQTRAKISLLWSKSTFFLMIMKQPLNGFNQASTKQWCLLYCCLSEAFSAAFASVCLSWGLFPKRIPHCAIIWITVGCEDKKEDILNFEVMSCVFELSASRPLALSTQIVFSFASWEIHEDPRKHTTNFNVLNEARSIDYAWIHFFKIWLDSHFGCLN